MNKSHSTKGLMRLIKAFNWSISGLKKGFQDEIAFQQEVFLFILLAPIGLWMGQTKGEKCLLIGVLFLVLIVELLNSSIEAAIDRIGEDIHPLSGKAKDMGSAAVFLALLNAAVVWVIILFC